MVATTVALTLALGLVGHGGVVVTEAFSSLLSSAVRRGRNGQQSCSGVNGRTFLKTTSADQCLWGGKQQHSTVILQAAAAAEEQEPSTLTRLPDSAVEVTLHATSSQTKQAYDRVMNDLSKSMSVPGFRKGSKLPPSVLENAVAAKKGTDGKIAIKSQTITMMLQDMVEFAIKEEHSLEPIGQPTLTVKTEELAKDFTPGEPLEMTVRCDVWPDLEWKEVEGEEGKKKAYEGLTGTYKRKPFDQVRFDKAMGDLRDRYATLEDSTDPLVMGDAAVVNMVGYMAEEDGVTKGEPLPNAASGDNVEVILGEGRYMEGLVEGLVGATVGDTRTVKVSFPVNLRDKSLAGKRAIFDVTVEKTSKRVLPDLDDDFAANVRPGLDLEGLEAELRKAIDEEDAKEFVDERNDALAKSLADVMEVDVPDTVVTQQAQQKYAEMMADMRGTSGMSDADLQAQITPENFQKYKKIVQDDIIRDFKVGMAIDEIARAEGMDVPSNQVDEQLAQLKRQSEESEDGSGEEFDATKMRAQVESALQRRMVFDYLAEHANLDVEYVEEQAFDADLMERLAQESLEREQQLEEEAKKKAAAEAEA